jgi:hypothetical protein
MSAWPCLAEEFDHRGNPSTSCFGVGLRFDDEFIQSFFDIVICKRILLPANYIYQRITIEEKRAGEASQVGRCTLN